jgi:hypothetical protein
MKKYSQGVCQDGAAILEDGIPLTPDQIVEKLNCLSQLTSMIYLCPELNMCNYSEDQVEELNNAVQELWETASKHTDYLHLPQ